MKILQATERFLSDDWRGVEWFVYELSRGLRAAGHDVTVLAGGRGRDRVLGSIRIEHASMSGARMARWAGGLHDRHIAYVPPGILNMYRHGPDVVHAHHLGSGYAASLLKRYDGTPYVLTIYQALPDSSPVRAMYKKALEGASAVISVSEYVRGRIKKDFGVSSVVIPLARKFEHVVSEYIAVYDNAVEA